MTQLPVHLSTTGRIIMLKSKENLSQEEIGELTIRKRFHANGNPGDVYVTVGNGGVVLFAEDNNKVYIRKESVTDSGVPILSAVWEGLKWILNRIGIPI